MHVGGWRCGWGVGGWGGVQGRALIAALLLKLRCWRFMVCAACWGIQVRGGRETQRTPCTFSAVSSFSMLTTPSVWEASITCSPSPGRKKMPSTAYVAPRQTRLRAPPLERKVWESLHPAPTLKNTLLLSPNPDGGRRARAQTAENTTAHTEPTRSFIHFYLLEDTTNSKYRCSNAINGKKNDYTKM